MSTQDAPGATRRTRGVRNPQRLALVPSPREGSVEGGPTATATVTAVPAPRRPHLSVVPVGTASVLTGTDRLRALTGSEVLFLAERRLGRGRLDGSICLLAVGASGVSVLALRPGPVSDVTVLRTGGLLRAPRHRLELDGRDATRHVDALVRQQEVVRTAILDSPVPVVVRAVLSLPGAQLPRIGTQRVNGVALLTPEATARLVAAPGPLGPRERQVVLDHLARALPPA